MMYSTDIVFRDIQHSPALSARIYKKLEKLSRYSDSITHTRVVLDSPHNHKQKGKMFRASVELMHKGTPVIVSRDDIDAYVALRDAFDVVERKIKETSSRLRSHRTGQDQRMVPEQTSH